MKILLLLSLATLACSARLSINQPLNQAINPPIKRPISILDIISGRSLADDLEDIEALLPKRELKNLVRRYLMGDQEFQAIIRYLMSQDANRAMEAIFSQPEIRELYSWLQLQMLVDDDSSSAEILHLILRRPGIGLISNKPGWAGFMENLLAIIPRQEIRNLIRDKVAANGVFAEFWGKIVALRPVYERIRELPEVRAFIDRLRQLGVDIEQLDQLIREELGWKIAGSRPGLLLGNAAGGGGIAGNGGIAGSGGIGGNGGLAGNAGIAGNGEIAGNGGLRPGKIA